jgi:hypothetical protein
MSAVYSGAALQLEFVYNLKCIHSRLKNTLYPSHCTGCVFVDVTTLATCCRSRVQRAWLVSATTAPLSFSRRWSTRCHSTSRFQLNKVLNAQRIVLCSVFEPVHLYTCDQSSQCQMMSFRRQRPGAAREGPAQATRIPGQVILACSCRSWRPRPVVRTW